MLNLQSEHPRLIKLKKQFDEKDKIEKQIRGIYQYHCIKFKTTDECKWNNCIHVIASKPIKNKKDLFNALAGKTQFENKEVEAVGKYEGKVNDVDSIVIYVKWKD